MNGSNTMISENIGILCDEKEKKSVTENITKGDRKRGQKKGTEKLTKTQLQIMKYIEENKHVTIKELTRLVDVVASKVKLNISILKKNGLIERVGPDKGGFWKVTKN